MNKISNDHQNLELILPSLDVIDQILNILQKLDDGATLHKQKKIPNFRDSIESFNNLYVNMSEKLIKDSKNQEIQDDMQHYKQELETFKKYNNILLKIL
jgi:hypothetical protein